MASVPAWCWFVAGWMLIALGAWLLLTGRLSWRRLKGRLCGRCGYDMSGTASMTCFECGHTAHSERDLVRRRGSLLLRTLGVVLAAIGWLGLRVPPALAGGWAAAIPDWALARVAPVEASRWNINVKPPVPPPSLPSSYSDMASWSTSVRPPAPALAAPNDPEYTWTWKLHDALYDDLWRRLKARTIDVDSGAAYLRRRMKIDPSLYRPVAPPRWAVGGPVIELAPVTAAGAPKLYAEVSEHQQTGNAIRVRYLTVVNDQRYVVGEAEAPSEVRASLDRGLDRLEDAAVSRAIGTGCAMRLVLSGPNAWIEADDRARGAPWDTVTCLARIRVRLLLNDREVGHTAFSLSPGIHGEANSGISAIVAWEEGGLATVQQNAGSLKLELSGDVAGAFEIYARNWKHEPTAWAGTVTVTPRVDVRTPVAPLPKGYSPVTPDSQ